MKFIKLSLLIISLAILSSCQKDDVVLTGTLKVTYINHPKVFYFYICPAENPALDISHDLILDNNGTLTYELNAGNYILNGYGENSTYLSSRGFQIKAGVTTTINFYQ